MARACFPATIVEEEGLEGVNAEIMAFRSILSLILGVLLISILLAIHRTEERRAFWLGFALFGSSYLGFSLVSSIESRLITTRAWAFCDSKVQKSIPAGFAYADVDNDGRTDLYVVNNSQRNALYLNKGNGTFQDVTLATGLYQAGPSLTGSSGTTENFVRNCGIRPIGGSYVAVSEWRIGTRSEWGNGTSLMPGRSQL